MESSYLYKRTPHEIRIISSHVAYSKSVYISVNVHVGNTLQCRCTSERHKLHMACRLNHMVSRVHHMACRVNHMVSRVHHMACRHPHHASFEMCRRIALIKYSLFITEITVSVAAATIYAIKQYPQLYNARQVYTVIDTIDDACAIVTSIFMLQ